MLGHTYPHPAYRPSVISLTTQILSPDCEPTTVLKAESRHDIQGKVSEFGAELEFLWERRMIWFKKTD